MEDARISCEQLAQLLDEEPKLVLLDVRSFVLFNQSHLRDAVNVCVPRTLAKRPGFNIKNLEAGICKKCEKDLFRTREGHVVVLYDQTGDDADASGLLAKCFEALSAEGLCSAVYWVQGGFASIQAELPERVEATRKQDEQLSKSSAPGLALPRGLAAAAGPGAFPRLPMAAFTAPANPSPNEKIVQITEYLYLSGSNIAEDLECLRKNHIRYIVNSAQELDNYFSATNDFVYTRLDLQDHPRQAICFEKIFDFAFKAIDEAKRSGCRALVHCRGGKSRSATVVIAYLMRTYDWSLQQAYEYVQKKSPKISPNLGFMGQLLEYEKYLSRKRGSPVPAGKVPSPQVMAPSAIHRQLGGSPLCSPDIKREQTTPPLWSISSLSLRT